MNQLSICVGTSCHLNGANNIVVTFRHLIEEYGLHDKLTLNAMFCAKNCSNKDVAVRFNDEIFRIHSTEARQFFLYTVLPRMNGEAQA